MGGKSAGRKEKADIGENRLNSEMNNHLPSYLRNGNFDKAVSHRAN